MYAKYSHLTQRCTDKTLNSKMKVASITKMVHRATEMEDERLLAVPLLLNRRQTGNREEEVKVVRKKYRPLQ